MFQFRRFPSHTYLIQYGMTGHDSGRIAPFRHLRINVCLRLPAAFRSLPRLSSASDAKAFALRPYSLDPLRIIVFLQRFKFKIVVFPKRFVLFSTFDFSLYFAFLFVQFSSYRRQLSLPSSQLSLPGGHKPRVTLPFWLIRLSPYFASGCSLLVPFSQLSLLVGTSLESHSHFGLYGFRRTSLRVPLCLFLLRSFRCWWAQVDSNHRPHAYQACALTT